MTNEEEFLKEDLLDDRFEDELDLKDSKEKFGDINLGGFLELLKNPKDKKFWYYYEDFDSLGLSKDGSMICAGLKGGFQKKGSLPNGIFHGRSR